MRIKVDIKTLEKYEKRIISNQQAFNSISGKMLDKCSELLQLKTNSEINKELKHCKDIEILKIFSHLRENLISWIPFTSNDEILLLGNDFGVFSSFLAGNVKHIDLVDDSYESCLFSTIRTEEFSNVTIFCEDIRLAEEHLEQRSYDFILFAEELQINTKVPEKNMVDILKTTKKFLKKSGKVVFWCNNSLGLKYWSGCADDVQNQFFTGIEGYPGENEKQNPTLKDLKESISDLEYTYSKIYYPYPDALFPMSIYSDGFLPLENDLSKNAFSWEERIVIFNEVSVWNNLIKNNLFEQFSNSYLVLLSDENHAFDDLNIFTKFSNDRSEKFSIRTDIYLDDNGKKRVKKLPVTHAAENHLNNMVVWKKRLDEVYAGTNIQINRILNTQGGIEFEYLTGNAYVDGLKKNLADGNYPEFLNQFKKFTDTLMEKNTEEFYITEQFEEVFGYVDLPPGLKSGRVSNIDLILSNVISQSNFLQMIDYEWVFDFPVPVNFIIYRSIDYLFKGPRGALIYNPIYLSNLLEYFAIDDVQVKEYGKMEENFQNYVLRDHVPLRKINRKVPLADMKSCPRFYFDFGKGFNKRNMVQGNGVIDVEGKYKHRIGLPFGLKRLRIDPTENYCIVKITSLFLGGAEIRKPDIITNGKKIGEDIYIFNLNYS